MTRARSATASCVATGLLAALVTARTVLARRAVRRYRTQAAARNDQTPWRPGRPALLREVTVLIPIRSGDPLLPETLARCVDSLAPAEVLLLVDDDDPAGAAAAAAARSGRARVMVCPPPPTGHNPKVHKLAYASAQAGRYLAVVDDDVVVPPGGLARLTADLQEADLVTGVPHYRDQGGLWSRLLAAFVNGSALPTYLSMAQVGPPVSINGMIVVTRREALQAVGGWAAIAAATCDDYALARAYRARGLRIMQAAVPVELSTTVASPAAYGRIMRRWMMFASQVVRHDCSLRLLTLVVAPALLPAAAVALAWRARSPLAAGAVGAVMVGESLATSSLRRMAQAGSTSPAATLLGLTARLLTPLHALTCVVGSRTVVWRDRSVRM